MNLIYRLNSEAKGVVEIDSDGPFEFIPAKGYRAIARARNDRRLKAYFVIQKAYAGGIADSEDDTVRGPFAENQLFKRKRLAKKI